MNPSDLVTALADERITPSDFLRMYLSMNKDLRAEIEHLLGEAVQRESTAGSL
jgi:hypothetical protein